MHQENSETHIDQSQIEKIIDQTLETLKDRRGAADALIKEGNFQRGQKELYNLYRDSIKLATEYEKRDFEYGAIHGAESAYCSAVDKIIYTILWDWVDSYCINRELTSNIEKDPRWCGGFFDDKSNLLLSNNEKDRPFYDLDGAELGNIIGPHILGVTELLKHFLGRTFPADKMESLRLGTDAYHLADQYHQEGNFSEAASIYNILAYDSCLPYDSAMLNDFGRDYPVSLAHLLLSDKLFLNLFSEKNISPRLVTHRLSEYYRHGLGVQRDYDHAIRYRKMMADTFLNEYQEELNHKLTSHFENSTEYFVDVIDTELWEIDDQTRVDQQLQRLREMIGETPYDRSVWYAMAGKPINPDLKYRQILDHELIHDNLISATYIGEGIKYQPHEFGHIESMIVNKLSNKEVRRWYAEHGDLNSQLYLAEKAIDEVSFLQTINGVEILEEVQSTEIQLHEAIKTAQNWLDWNPSNKEVIKIENHLNADGSMSKIWDEKGEIIDKGPIYSYHLFDSSDYAIDPESIPRITHPLKQFLRGELHILLGDEESALSCWRSIVNGSTVQYKECSEEERVYPLKFMPTVGKAASKLIEIEKRIAAENAAREKEHELYAYLTHILRNSLSSGPETLRQTQRILKKELKDHPIPPKVLRNIGSLFSTFVFTDSMITTFKQLVTSPDSLNRGWQQDSEGEGNVEWLLALSIRQVLARVLFSDRFFKARKMAFRGDIDIIQRSFMDNLMSADLSAGKLEPLYAWCKEYLPILEIHLDDSAQHYQFSNDQVRFSILFATFSELITNALKYWSGEGAIQIRWRKEKNGYQFILSNPTSRASQSSTDSSHKGITFIETVLEKLELMDFSHGPDKGRYVTQLRITEATPTM